MGKDKFLGGLIKGKSDPYGVLEVGTNVFRSKIIHETVNPKWNEVFEVGLQPVPSIQMFSDLGLRSPCCALMYLCLEDVLFYNIQCVLSTKETQFIHKSKHLASFFWLLLNFTVNTLIRQQGAASHSTLQLFENRNEFIFLSLFQ